MTRKVSNDDEPSAIRCFLDEASVLSWGEPVLSIAEMRSFVCGLLNRSPKRFCYRSIFVLFLQIIKVLYLLLE